MKTADTQAELALVRDVLAAHASTQDALLPVLQDIQHRIGWVPQSAVNLVAQALNLSRADVHGVASFYHDLRDAPAGRHVIQLCQAEACQAVGCRGLAAHAQRRLGIPLGATTSDGIITLERAYCFGNCACGPTVRVDDRLLGRVTDAGFDRLVADLRQPSGPQ
jgi:formate dehydrogenase subunit gamma